MSVTYELRYQPLPDRPRQHYKDESVEWMVGFLQSKDPTWVYSHEPLPSAPGYSCIKVHNAEAEFVGFL